MNALGALKALYPRLIAGDARAAIADFAAGATVDSPLGGHQGPRAWALEHSAWLRSHDASPTEIATVGGGARVVHELQLRLAIDGAQRELPVLLVADVRDDTLRDLRIYHSTWPLTGHHAFRRPVLDPAHGLDLPEPLASYERALAAGDIDSLQALFEPDGYVREPAGDEFRHVGPAREDFYGPLRTTGGVPLKPVSVTADDTHIVMEYICDEWGGTHFAAQAGAAVWERTPEGRIAAIRIYDDVMPPEGLFD